VDFAILGPLEVAANGRVLELGPPKQRAVLAALLLHANEIVATDRLIEMVWGDSAPRTAAHSVQIYVSDLRKRFDEVGASPVITTRAPGYVLHIEPDAVDAHRFERLVVLGSGQVRSGDVEAGAHTLDSATAMWRGPPLADLTYVEFVQPRIRRLEELRHQAVEELAGAQLRLGRVTDALAQVTALVEEQPLREHAREVQLLALYRCGRQAEALRCYEGFRRRLADELGVDPSPALQQLQGRILLQDASLVPGVATADGDAQLRNPFKGLRAFTEIDADDFFGRRELVSQVCEALATGVRLVTLVGPSGCGKSSVVAAGLIPALRAGAVAGSQRWQITSMVPGPEPGEELARVLARRTEPRPAAAVVAAEQPSHRTPRPSSDGRRLLVIDQFEELFTLASEPEAAAFLHELTDALLEGDGGVQVVVALRGDFYDRPLLHPRFAALFTAHVINVLPLKAAELEAAMTEPARRVGVQVEPALLAEAVADAVGQPGALPLFQYTLTELFEHRDGAWISLSSYRQLGGLHGALSRRAEDIYGDLTPAQQQVAEQVFLRLVTPGEGTRDVRRRASAREFGALGLDPVDTADVLDRFGRHRLLTFDRDPVSGDATVEVAHEALLEAWARLRGWIDDHRTDLRRLERLSAVVDEWIAADRDDGYLLSGGRLAQYDSWSERTALLLPADVRSYLEASRARWRTDQEQDAARRAQEARLRARARTRLWALFVAVLLLSAATTGLVLTARSDRPPDVALVIDQDAQVIWQMLSNGAERAGHRVGLDVEMVTPVNDVTVGGSAARGARLVIFHTAHVTRNHPAEHPETHFAILDHVDEPQQNATFVTFAEHEGSFLVGAAAALESETGRIGFIGGVDFPLIWRFQAGFEAGARHVDPGVRIDSVYLTEPPDISGFGSPTLAARAAEDLYRSGTDVVYHAAGGAGFGLLETVVAESQRQGRHLWAIGVDADEYRNDGPEAVLGEPRMWRFGPEDWKPHLLTSMVKRFDVAVDRVIADFGRGVLAPGERVFDLANGGIDYATSGGFVDDLVPRLDELKADIIAGRIQVPTVPADRRDPSS
jgi:basic membrane lipoprotein Med (substrate-binding protein (PBP1-ABC) superfamily)/DNA-binding SARP family transcriptional activator